MDLAPFWAGILASYLFYIISALGGYALVSLYLLENPHILHRRKRSAFHCTHIAHRGGAGERIESTMEAFTHAVKEGADMFELDCHLTSDGCVVVSHDENLLRQTGRDVPISSLNLEELPLYKERLEVTFYEGRYSTGEDRRFILLEDLFKQFARIPVSIEIKEDNALLIKEVSSLVKQYEREDITLWATEKSHIMEKCQRENPSMPYMFTLTRGLQLLLLYYSGLLPFVPLGESVLLTYLPRIINRKYIPESPILKNRMIISLIDKLTMRKGLLKHLAKRGIQVLLFVCNEEDDIEAAFTVGATGVMTDYPSLLSNYLRTHPRS